MMKQLILSILWLFVAGTAWSIPAQLRPFTVTNSDGTVLTITLCGDECCHFYATLDGLPVVEDANTTCAVSNVLYRTRPGKHLAIHPPTLGRRKALSYW